MSDPDLNELDALSTLVSSDGWRLFTEMCQASHGDRACVAQIDRALADVSRGDHKAVQDTVQQIRSAARAVDRLVRWPHERIAQLKVPKKSGAFLTRRRVS